MSKLSNLKGRIDYIASPARQENLYAVYDTTDRTFWNELAECNQKEFMKSGTKGICIEARELIIALPESFTDYEPYILLKLFTEHFKQSYGTECISALHHNKRKTNYHIHLIFSERNLLKEPIEKIAVRNMFYNECGKHVRTKREILDESGQVRLGCKIIFKGGVYERNLFTPKDSKFKNEQFLNDIKHSYTDLINIYVKNDKEHLQVFEQNGIYLPMKKIGKNNPKKEQLEADNQMRRNWNRTIDRAFISGVPEVQIVEIRRKEINEKVKESIQKFGKNPRLFATIIIKAIMVLEHLITQIFRRAFQKLGKSEGVQETMPVVPIKSEINKPLPKLPVKSILATKISNLSNAYQKLERQNTAIYQKEQQLGRLEVELSNCKGVYKGKQRVDLQKQIRQLKPQIENMKHYLSAIANDYGYENVKEFMEGYSKAKSEYDNYKKAVFIWENHTSDKTGLNSMERLEYQKQIEKKHEDEKMHIRSKERHVR